MSKVFVKGVSGCVWGGDEVRFPREGWNEVHGGDFIEARSIAIHALTKAQKPVDAEHYHEGDTPPAEFPNPEPEPEPEIVKPVFVRKRK